MQKRQYCIQVKILYQSDKRAFSNKLCPSFFIYFILFLYNFPLVSKSSEYTINKFSLKNSDVAFRLKFLTSRNLGHFRTKFTKISFSFKRIFHFLLQPQNMQSAGFGEKMTKLHSGQNSGPVGTNGTFEQILSKFFFFQKYFPFFSWTTKYAINKFRCKNADNVFQAKLLTSRTKGHFLTNFALFFFFFIFIFIYI